MTMFWQGDGNGSRVIGINMIHLMNMAHFTGNPPYSISSYSCIVASVGGHAETAGDHIVDRQYGGAHRLRRG